MINHTGSVILQTAFFLVTTKQNGSDLPVNTLDNMKNGGDMEALCFGHLGCYSINAPWTAESRPVSLFPQPPEVINPRFCLYTRNNPLVCQKLSPDDPESLYRSFLIPTHRVYFIAHGFLENGQKPWIKLVTKKLLQRQDCNVVSVGWGGGSSPPYTQAVANIRLVGAITAQLINLLHRTVGVKTENCHMIGHSLGAHLSGYVGSTLITRFNLTLGRITGLDPAEPHFSQTDPVVRLDPTDALFVDVIHTDAVPFITGGLGIDEPVGHLDFYPNGGMNQPGCDHMKSDNGSFVEAFRRFVGCDHVRSYEYFIESINSPCSYLAIECSSWEDFKAGLCYRCRSEIHPEGRACARLGFDAIRVTQEQGYQPDQHPVKLYSLTSDRLPYCRALYRVKIEISNSKKSQDHKGEVGEFHLELDGVKANTEQFLIFKEQYYRPGSVHIEMTGQAQVGRLRAARLHWKHHITMNILTWRIDRAKIHVHRLHIDNIEEDSSTPLCPEKTEVIFSDSYIVMKPCEDAPPIDQY